MQSLSDELAVMDSAEREAALTILDRVSRPLTKREIETALAEKGVSRSRRKIIASALEPFHIIAAIGPEANYD